MCEWRSPGVILVLIQYADTVLCADLYLIERCVPGEMYFSNLLASKLHSAVVPPAFAISSSGDRIFTIMQDSSQVETWGMLYLSSGYYSDVEFVTSMTGFGAQYFTCNNQVQTPIFFVPLLRTRPLLWLFLTHLYFCSTIAAERDTVRAPICGRVPSSV